MKCANCNTETQTGGKFCRKCGLPLPVSSGELGENPDDVVTRELDTAMAKAAAMTSGSLSEKIPQTERVTNDLLNRPEVSVKTNSQDLSSAGSMRKKVGIGLVIVGLLSVFGLGYMGMKRMASHKEALGATLAAEEVTSFLADYKSKEPHAMARHILSSRPIAEDAISQVGKLLTSGSLELVDYSIVKADQVGSDVTVQISGTVKLNGNPEKFNDTVLVHGDSGRWRILPPTLDQVSEQGSPSYMVGSFLETILLAKLEQPAAAQPATKQKPESAPAQPSATSGKQLTPPADPKPAPKPAETAPRPEPGDRRGPPDGQPPRPGGPGTTVTIPPRPGFGPPDGRQFGPMGMGNSRLQVLSMPQPKYTDAARASKVQGTVWVIATFKADGSVGSPQVVRGLGYGLDEAALEVVKHVKFNPERVEGRPVDATKTVRVPFVLPNS